MVNNNSTSNAIHLPSNISDLPPEWLWKRLEDICLLIVDCPHSTPKITDNGPLMVRTQDVLPGIFRTENAAHVSEETYKERTKRAEPTYGDLLYSREGTYFGIAAEVPLNIRVCLGQRMVLIRPDSNHVDFRFLRYWLNSSLLSSHIYGHRDGSVAERLNLPTIRALPVPLPSIPEQQAIAHILNSLDDKIELNRQMNDTLEGITRALFKSWFVDFDPVRAKMEGRQPYGMDAETAALFPDGFEDSTLGMIPRDWKVITLASEIEILSGGTPKTNVAEYWGGAIPWVSVVDTVPGPYITGTEKTITALGVENSAAKIFPVETIIITARGTVGNCALLSRSMAMNQSCYGLRGKTHIEQLFLFHQVLNQISKLKTSAHGSVFDTITRSTFDNILVVLPEAGIRAKFELIARPLFDQILNNQLQSITLSTLRDTLLPKLLSGEIRVSDAEKEVEAAL